MLTPSYSLNHVAVLQDLRPLKGINDIKYNKLKETLIETAPIYKRILAFCKN
jgi:hypothetical protein